MEMYCIKCGAELTNNETYCEKCAEIEAKKKIRKKSFWDEVEKNQTTIEEFGYRVNTEIRKSDNTVVYLATNDEEETVAIKKISVPYKKAGDSLSESAAQKDVTERIRSEMETLSKISSGSENRFVITYYDYKLVENVDKLKYDLYIRMDYLTSLGQVYSEAKLRIRDLLAMGSDICDALDWCHKNGRIHNNLNLNNIFISADGRYVLGDFATFANKQNEVAYCMAPELFYGESASDVTDIYSLGMVMYVLLNNGLPPFSEAETAEEFQLAVSRLKNGEVPVLGKHVNHRLSDVITRALSARDQRFQSVGEMKKAIEYLLVSMPGEWLDYNVKAIVSKEITESVEEMGDDDALDVNHTEVVSREGTNSVKSLAPEEIALKKKNRKDLWILGVIIVALVALVAAGTIFLYNGGNRKIYSLIDSEAYAVAFKEISGLYEDGQNVDELVRTYVDACVSDSEYNRVVQALPLFSEEAYADSKYFLDLFVVILNSGKNRQIEAVYSILYEKENLQPLLDEITKQ